MITGRRYSWTRYAYPLGEPPRILDDGFLPDIGSDQVTRYLVYSVKDYREE